MTGLRLSRDFRIVLLLMTIAAVMSLFLSITKQGVDEDSLKHLMPAHELAAGRGYIYRGSPQLLMPPGYGMIAYIAYLLVGDIEYSGIIVSSASYLLLIPLAYHAGRRMFDRKVGLLSAFYATFSPVMVYFSHQAFSDCLFSLFIMLGLITYYEILSGRRSLVKSMLYGALIGYAYLIRPEGFLIMLFSAAYLFAVERRETGDTLKSLKHPMAVMMAFIVLAAPYVMFVHAHTGLWTMSPKISFILVYGEKVVDGLEAVQVKMEEHPEYFQPGYRLDVREYLMERGWKYVIRVGRNVMHWVSFFTAMDFHAILPLTVLFFFTVLSRDTENQYNVGDFIPDGRKLMAFIIFMIPSTQYILFCVIERYLLPFTTIMLIPLSAAALRVADKTVRHLGVAYGNGLAIICITSLIAASGTLHVTDITSLYFTFTEPDVHAGIMKAGLWLGENAGDDGNLRILAPRMGDVILFYANGKKNADGEYVNLHPGMDVDEVSLILRNGSADYLVLDFNYVKRRPMMYGLWNTREESLGQGIGVVYEDPEGYFKVYRAS
ncbi:MAG: glycosyltransferase family 39 protein [Candidatus Altiarchaeota archaeon]